MNIDVTRLPADVVALVDALVPGDDLVITRDGAPIATITALPGAPAVDLDAPDDVTVVATAMRLPESARTSLSAALGPDYIVLDLPAAPATADVLLVPPVSPQLIGILRSRFPNAQVIVAEFEDAESGISFQGPVRRLLDAGAETYLTATTVPRLAAQLDHVVTQRHQLTAGTAEPREIDAGDA